MSIADEVSLNMKVSIESLGNIERAMTVEIPSDEVVQKVEADLKKYAGQASLPYHLLWRLLELHSK